ncbi:hypothetical protein Tco_0548778 [Tanacetum coccineum]
MEPQLGLYVRLGEMLGLGFSQLVSEPGWAQWWCGWCSLGRRYEKGGIVAIVEGEAHGGLGLRGGLLGVQTQSHIGKIIISKLTYKLGGLLLLSPIGFRMEPQLGLYVRLGEMLGLGYPTIGIRARLGPVVVWMVFPRLDPGSTVLVDPGKPCIERKPAKNKGLEVDTRVYGLIKGLVIHWIMAMVTDPPWKGADEEISEGGSPRVIVLGYDGLPIQLVAPPSPDYIPGLEEPQTPPVPQDEDERKAMFIQPHVPDYVPEPIYPEYIPLEDEHVFSVEEKPLPPIDLPTAESLGYVAESDPEEDPEEYEDDETEDGPVDYPMDGGDDRDDDDGDSSEDDADDEEEYEEEEEEEHLAPADSDVVVPTVELVSPPEGTKPVIPPPSTDISTTGARITVRLQASISLPPKEEVERLLAMPTPSPSPPISLSPPFAGERLARCTAPSAHSSPLPVPLPLLPSSGCPTQIQTLRIASTQALIDVVTATLPSPLLPPLPPSLYIPPPVACRDDVLESELPPRKRLCLSTLGSRYEIGESSTARPIGGRGIDYGFFSTMDAEARRQGISEFVANEIEKVDKYISGLPDNIYGNVKSARPKTLDETIELANDLMDQKLRTYAERQSDNKRKADDSSRNNHGHQQQPFKRQNSPRGLQYR